VLHPSPWLSWFLAGIVFFAVELLLPGFIVFFFGVGAWITALIMVVADPALATQLMIFLVTSLATLFALRGRLQTVFAGNSRNEGDSPTVRPLGRTATVTRDIQPPGRGQVSFGGTFWPAEADREIRAGQVVEVVEQDDLVVRVRIQEKEEK